MPYTINPFTGRPDFYESGGTPVVFPITVAEGGTGQTSLTDGAVLIGNGTNPITQISLTDGQLLIGSTGLDPAAASLTQPAAGITITGGAGTVTFALADDLAAVEGLAATGLATRIASNTWTTRTLQQPAAGIIITNPEGVSGNPTFTLANDLLALENLGTTGMAARTGTSTWSTRTITQPPAGITVTNGDGVAGNPTLGLADDLAAVEGLATTGIAARTASNTWTTRTLTAGAGISITNGDGVSGNPTITATATAFAWNDVTGTSASAAVNNGYQANNAGLVTITLPVSAAQFSVIRVSGLGAGGWLVAQNSGQSIIYGTSTSTTGVTGSISSSHRYDTVELLCVTANTTWKVISVTGSITVT